MSLPRMLWHIHYLYLFENVFNDQTKRGFGILTLRLPKPKLDLTHSLLKLFKNVCNDHAKRGLGVPDPKKKKRI